MLTQITDEHCVISESNSTLIRFVEFLNVCSGNRGANLTIQPFL